MERTRVSRILGPSIAAAMALLTTACPSTTVEPHPIYPCLCTANFPDFTSMPFNAMMCAGSSAACNSICLSRLPPGAISGGGTAGPADPLSCDPPGGVSHSLLACETFEGSIVGSVVDELSWVSVHSNGHTGGTTPFGSDAVWITGGDCPGSACGFDIHWFLIRANDFAIGGYPVQDFHVIGNGVWHGEKYADNTYLITGPGTPSAFGYGYVDGDRASQQVFAEAPIQGEIYFEEPDPHMTIDGTFINDGNIVSTYTYIEFDRGAPRPRTTWTYDPGTKKYVLSSWLITQPLGFTDGQLGYDWFAKAGTQGEYKIGSGKKLWLSQLPPFPIKVVVSNPDHFVGEHTMYK